MATSSVVQRLEDELLRERIRSKRLTFLLALAVVVVALLLGVIAVLVLGLRDGIGATLAVIAVLAALITLGVWVWKGLQWIAERLSR